jgi:hypothetical protein
MKNKIKVILLILAFSMVLSTSALAAGDYQMSWWTIDNGGGTLQSSGGQYELSGTIGQWDAGASTSEGDYTLNGGFWAVMKSILFEYLVYLPLITR